MLERISPRDTLCGFAAAVARRLKAMNGKSIKGSVGEWSTLALYRTIHSGPVFAKFLGHSEKLSIFGRTTITEIRREELIYVISDFFAEIIFAVFFYGNGCSKIPLLAPS